MTLRNQLKNVKIQNAETIQSYFKRVSQIKEQLEVVDGEVENAEIVMTTLNGLPRSWDSFIQGIYARNKLVKISRLWEEFSHEEAQITAQEEKMESEDQALTVHSKNTIRSSHHPRGKHSHKDKGHYARECPRNKNVIHVTRKDTMLENVLETKMSLTRRMETREDIMLMLQRMMSLPRREPDMKVKIIPVMKSMF